MGDDKILEVRLLLGETDGYREGFAGALRMPDRASTLVQFGATLDDSANRPALVKNEKKWS